MTNTVTIPSNVLPEDGRFGSGPTKIRPEQIQALDKGARNLLGTSHRQTPIKQVVGSIREGLSEFFQIPDGYEVVLGNGGASAFWDIACASLITRKAAFGTYGSFSSKFAKSAQSAPFLEEPEIFAEHTACLSSRNTWTLIAGPTMRLPPALPHRSNASQAPRSRVRSR
jgi:phosphoserine aminotransferase